MKRILSFLLAAGMLAGLATGCSDSGASSSSAASTPASSAPQSSAASSTPAGDAAQGTLASDKLLELSIFVPSGTTDVTTSLNPDMPVMQELEKRTNIRFKFTTGTKEEMKEKFPLMMADPGTITDVVTATIPEAMKFGQQGAFIPLQDLLPQYPNLQKHIVENPDIMRSITDPDGNVYTIPGVPAHTVGEVWYIRKDWLDKLGLEIPKTMDELTTVLKAFKEQDPNGNGSADEVPFWCVSKNDVRALSWPFGIDNTWYVTEAGEPDYGPANPAYKDYVEYMAMLYKEGLMDQEYLTRTGNKRDFFLHGNTGGLVHSFAGATGRYNNTAPDATGDKNFQLLGIAPFTGTSTKIVDRTGGSPISDTGYSISVNNKHVEETLKFIDYTYSDECTLLHNFGIEGQSYEMKDGNPLYKQDFFKAAAINLDELMAIGAKSNLPQRVDIRYEDQTTDAAYNAVKDLYEGNDYVVGAFPKIPFTKEEQKLIDKYEKQAKDFVDENTAKWISGQQTTDNFDSYLTTLKTSFGMDELIQVYKTAYARYMSVK